MNDLAYGFKILRPLELKDWKILAIDDTIPLDRQEYCPADIATPLKVVCTLVDDKGLRKIRLGWCVDCGYVGYIDRPEQQWMKDFYLSGQWDDGTSKKIPRKRLRRMNAVMSEHVGDQNKTTDLIEKLPLDKHRPILEIGCGYGESIGRLKRIGFSRIMAVENSTHRADLVTHTFGIQVFTAPFEQRDVQKALGAHAPFGLIFSQHVLEHVYYPDEVIQCASSLQKDGDYLVISVPYLLGELSMMIIAFLPHLHSFMPASLERLLNQKSYEVIDVMITDGCNMTLVARKKHNPVSNYSSALSSFDDIQTKFIKNLGMRKKQGISFRRVWWNRKTDIGGQMHFFTNPTIETFHYKLVSKIDFFRNRHIITRKANQSVLAQGLEHRFTSFQESPFEIQFDGLIFLFYK